MLGNVNIPYGTYDNVKLKLKLGSSPVAHTVYVSGNYVDGGIIIPVEIVIDEPLELMAMWKDPVTISSGMDYLSLLSLNFAQLTSGINATMLQQAMISNGTIVISNTSNILLYNLLLTNLQNMMNVQFQ